MNVAQLLSGAGQPASAISADAAAAPPATAAGTGGAAFDAILALEALAAEIAALDGPAADAELVDAEGLALDDTEDGDEEEGPFAFLASLLAIAPAPGSAGTSTESEGGVGAGGGGQPSPADLAAGLAQAANDDSLEAAIGAATGSVAKDAAGSGADIARQVFQTLAEGLAGNEQAAAPEAAARGVEFLAPGARTSSATGAAAATLMTPARDPRWADELANRVTMMVRGAESSASLQLTPAELGPLDVNVTVRDGQASVHFGAAQAETRALLEASLPRLREMLEAGGFQLTDASVSSGFARERRDAPHAQHTASESAELVAPARAVLLDGLLDVYA